MFKFKKGQIAQDVITGFEGTITARADYITGCNQYSLASQVKDNKPADYQWFDENRIKIVGDAKVMSFINGSPEVKKTIDKSGPQHTSPRNLLWKINIKTI